jgi:4-hydroxybenzoate polyprenyltransferase
MVMGIKRNGVLRVLDAVFLARPLLLVPVWGFCGFGYFAGIRHGNLFSVSAAWSASWHVFPWILVFSLSVGSVYIFNQIVDVKVDARNPGFALLVKGNIPLHHAWITAAVLAAAAVLLPLMRHPALSAFSAAALVLGVLYSGRPAYFSGRPILDFLTNATGYGIVSFGAGWLLSGAPFSMRCIASSGPYFFMMCAGSISSTIPDSKGDAAYGKRTTAVVFGAHRAHVLATLCLLTGLGYSFLAGDRIAIFCTGMSVPLYIFFLIWKSEPAMEATYKIGGLICMIAACIIFPSMVAASCIVASATMLYFRLRHHVHYPSLIPYSQR